MLFKVRSALKYKTSSPGCRSAKVGATLVTNPNRIHLCKGDIVALVDVENGIQEGSCDVGEFTPYTRKPSALVQGVKALEVLLADDVPPDFH